MERRESLAVLSAAATALALPWAVRARQPTSRPRIGVLSFGSAPGGANPDPGAGLRDGLRELGLLEGRNLAIEWRYADGRPERLAAELVQAMVALIVAGGPAPVRAARSATTTIPIVAISSPDPAGEGWARSLARPGVGITLSAANLQRADWVIE